ncbi:ATP-dependent Clp protease ATP-binding subunit [Pseudoclavibacter sp. 13-3]|uniref:ATP-dependent Clp protease ATP-binding subunit n=1 Tax=Pseudoclavibacter sp. 13-3 TaxID=2901228 RepID=UPI001E4FF200|nr:ATP-dependent Clp protease ATP-binding subunit [Pseudoclavibacter sp. 13-3]
MPENNTPNGSEREQGGQGSFDEFLARYLNAEQARQQARQQAAESQRSIDIGRFLTQRTQQALAEAGSYAVRRGQTEVDALHMLRVLAENAPVHEVLTRMGVSVEQLGREVEARLPVARDGATVTEAPNITPSLQRALFHAFQVARASGSTYVDLEHLFFALVLAQDAPAGQILSSLGVTAQSLTDSMRQPVPQPADATSLGDASAANAGDTQAVAGDEAGASGASAESQTPMLDRFGTDLTAQARDDRLDPVIGRADEIEQTVEILSRRTKNNPVLVGEAGVGKTAVVEGLAQAIAADEVPHAIAGRRLISLDLASMVAGTRFRGDFEERLTTLLDEITAHRDELIVFIDELHTVVGAGGSGAGDGLDAANVLKPRLARGELHMIGATTLDEYRRIEKDPALERRFQPVTVDEPSTDVAVRILHGVAPAFAEHHDVRYTDAALDAAVRLSARYLPDRRLPDKAIDLIDQAGARLRLQLGDRIDTQALMRELMELEAEKNAAASAEHYEQAGEIRDRIEQVQQALDAASAHNARIEHAHAATTGSATTPAEAVVDERQIAEVIARRTGIPVDRISEGERTRLAHLETELHDRVVGQHDAVAAVSRAVRRGRTGLGDPNRPVGSFLFLGPTGVGKTELAKTLAASLFGDEHALLRFDMSEFGEKHTAARLVGAPPGYVGYDEAGQLTEAVRRRPYSVLLLDEIEKAHPDVFNLLLQVLDDGRLTDGQGRTVDFRNTVVIMTSNIGSEFLASRSGALGFVANAGDDATGFGSEQALRDRVMGRLREAMRPEFLNRIDEIVLFRRLSREQVGAIARTMIAATAERLAEQGIRLQVSDRAVDWLAERGYEPEYGARPLRRTVQREVDDRIADLLVSGASGSAVTVDLVPAETADAAAAGSSADARLRVRFDAARDGSDRAGSATAGMTPGTNAVGAREGVAGDDAAA